MPAACLRNTGLMSPDIEMFATFLEARNGDKRDKHGPSTLSPVGFRVRTFPTLANESESAESGLVCGQSMPGLFAYLDLDSLSWKTSQLCLFEESTLFSATWPRAGMTRNGNAYRLLPLVPRISGTGCSLWLTPTVSAAEHPGQIKHKKGQQLRLAQQVNNPRFWPTPTDMSKGGGISRGGKRKGELLLGGMVKMFPTPVADDTGHRKSKYSQGGAALSCRIGGSLNPMWVEWLMGFPIGWTDLEASETL
jgi:hypothetical protein